MTDKKYKIKLSEEEMKTLFIIARSTGGYSNTRRHHMDYLVDGLRDYKFSHNEYTKGQGVYFVDKFDHNTNCSNT